VTGALTTTRIGLGKSNLTYALTDEAGGRWVARRHHSGIELAGVLAKFSPKAPSCYGGPR
jgi:hypothetical protein